MRVPFRPELDSLQTYVPPKSWRMAAEGRADDYAQRTPHDPALDPPQPRAPPKSGRMAAEGRADDYAKLTSNELAFGPLPEAEAALSAGRPRAHRAPPRGDAGHRE